MFYGRKVDENKFVISESLCKDYDINYILYFIEFNDIDSKIKINETFRTCISKFNLRDDLSEDSIFRITNLEMRFLIIYNSKAIHYVNMNTGKLVIRYEFEGFSNYRDQIKRIPFTNDLLVYSNKKLTYLKYGSKVEKLCEINIKIGNLVKISMYHNFLYVSDHSNFYIIDIDKVKENEKFEGSVTDLSQYKISDHTFSSDHRYLIYFTMDLELIVLRLSDFKQLALIPLLKRTSGIIASNKYISMTLQSNSKLLTMLLLDYENDDHKDYVKNIKFF